jgi:predicted cupin superfamily sugar epimerase
MDRDVESLSAEEIIAAFGLERHHAAGWFAPHYGDGDGWSRPRLSSIYHLLTGDEPLPLHKLDGVEVWHHYIGAPAEILVVNGIGVRETSLLGRDIFAGERPQLAVPAHLWQSCRSLGAWTLLGCTMSPGYSTRAVFMLDADD